jgi:hypothetical protein
MKTSKELEDLIKALKTGESIDYTSSHTQITVTKVVGGWWYITTKFQSTTSIFVEEKS